jgi:hypothetical protein
MLIPAVACPLPRELHRVDQDQSSRCSAADLVVAIGSAAKPATSENVAAWTVIVAGESSVAGAVVMNAKYIRESRPIVTVMRGVIDRCRMVALLSPLPFMAIHRLILSSARFSERSRRQPSILRAATYRKVALFRETKTGARRWPIWPAAWRMTEDCSAFDVDADVRIERETPNRVRRAEAAGHAHHQRKCPTCRLHGSLLGEQRRLASGATLSMCETNPRQLVRRVGFVDPFRIGTLP